MWCVAGAGLLALVGCNQVFGITPTQEYDASNLPPDMPHVVLDWQVAAVLPSGAPDPTIRFAPIDPAPRVRITPLDVPFPADPNNDPYKPIYSAGGDGWIQIPREYLNTTWRLAYTLADNVPHEVQWAPEDKQGHLTVPIFGRLERAPAPSGGGYAITPTGVAGFNLPRVLTTGLWTEGVINNYAAADGAKIDFDFFNAVSLSGAKGRPDPALGDRALLVDYLVDSSSRCRIATGTATLESAALEPNLHTALTPPWDTSSELVTSTPVNFDYLTRLTLGLSKVGSMFRSDLSSLTFGAAASTDMPGLTVTPEMSRLGLLLPVPVMLTLLQCPYSANPLPRAAQPMVLDPFPRVLHVQLVGTRQVQALGITLSSGMETVIASAAAGGFEMAFPAAMPMQFKLTTVADVMVEFDLAGDSDQVAVDPASGPFDLSFVPEDQATGLRADYYDVVLHRIANGGLTTERIYTVTAPKVRIDGALLIRGTDYVFEVRSYKGHPSAQHGDFAPVDYPYGAAIVFTRTFKAS
jgi:hypothetical protein